MNGFNRDEYFSLPPFAPRKASVEIIRSWDKRQKGNWGNLILHERV